MQHKVSTDLKLEALEKYYMDSPRKSQEREKNNKSGMSRTKKDSPQRSSPSRLKQNNQVKGPPRETIMNVTQDPQVIHRGEILEFDTLKK